MFTDRMVQNLMIGQLKKRTENGADALAGSAAGSLTDLFALAGSLRSRPEAIPPMYRRALIENRLLAAKLAFYTRDVRGGLGERTAGRMMFRVLAQRDPDAMRKNLALIPEYGRFDDLCDLLDTPVKEDVLQLLRQQLLKDISAMREGRPVSLLAKWLPSVNTSSHSSRIKAKKLASAFGYTEREYRKTLSALRSYLNVTEVRMSALEYEQIRYESVPSKAMNNYYRAFSAHDSRRFQEYMDSVKAGKKRIHSDTLYPYDIVMKYIDSFWSFDSYGPLVRRETDPVLEEQWKALPDLLDHDENTLVMVDISGSMYGRPIAASVGLGIYFAERNHGPFAEHILTFSKTPELVRLKGNSLRDKLEYVFSREAGLNTDLEAAFDLVLRAAVANQMSQSDLPERIVVISDSEIDRLRSSTDWIFVNEMKQRFEKAGYRMPSVVLWNVESRQNTFLALGDAENVQLCSGQSVSVFKSLIDTLHMDPYEYMIHVLNDPRYDAVTV